jgi:hypothetical protein
MKKITALLLIIVSLYGCEKIFFDNSKSSDDPTTNFEYLWNQVNEKYSLFDVKEVDWNEIHTRYAAKINSEMSNEDLFRVLGDMLIELKDGHVNLISDFNISHYNIEKLGQDNFDWRIVKDNYLPYNYIVTGPFVHDFVVGLDKKVGYIRFSEFSGMVTDTNLSYVLDRYKYTDGIILDIRENGGGTPTDMFSILSRFITKETKLYTSYLKNGPGKNDFEEGIDAILKPSDKTKYLNKVYVLTDRSTYSAGSFFALSTLAIDNVFLMGDKTGGGLGGPNGGQLPNGWRYRFSVTKTLDLQGQNFENGVPPDFSVKKDWTVLDRDEVIDQAILKILLNGK